MANERYFGRACKTCRRRGRGCDRRIPSCKTCETTGMTCEGYLLQWPGLASRGQLVGKSIPVTTKRRRTRRIQHSAIPSPPLPTVPKSPVLKSPVLKSPRITASNNDHNERQENHFEELLDPLQLFMEIPPAETSPDLLMWPDDDAFLIHNSPADHDHHLDCQPDLGTTSLQDNSRVLEGSMNFGHVLGPGLDILRIPDELKFIMQYHICEVVPKLCVDNLSPQNPYRDYILPLATEVPSLLYACGALAACHYNVRLSTKQFEREFFRFKGKAMKRLQEDLYSPVRASHPGTLATILMLCLCDLCHGGISDFQSHFQGAKKLIELRQERTAGSFVEQYLAWTLAPSWLNQETGGASM
ncbi:fungal-specific transcription factor domain-containing protein [Penicillium fimorum]|uniref:Fungal-specific transcription factor domain-containing protein n=1 Tax=Penicillium fimorum TaxID=1882269 RepID=A0A9W9XQ14_9EURO|nr:fungal-specific transcription factor domain-containing protein [Penicillium fimorum]